MLFWPYLAGAGAPYWNTGAAAAFAGLRHPHDLAVLTRAVLEGIAFENRAMLRAMGQRHVRVREIRVTGGGSTMREWNRIQSAIYRGPVQMLANPQATLLGAAIVGAVGSGVLPSFAAAVKQMVRVEETFDPDLKLMKTYENIRVEYERLGEAIRRYSQRVQERI